MRKVLLGMLVMLNMLGAKAQVLTEGFEGATFPPTGWVTINGGTGNNWVGGVTGTNGTSQTGTKMAQYLFNVTNAANAWLITSGVNLTAGQTYNITYWVANSGTVFPEKLRVTVGNDQTVAAQTTILQTINPQANITYTQQSLFYTAPTTGTYYFGWNCFSDLDEFYLNIDNINISLAPVTLTTSPSILGTFTSSTGVPSFQQSYNVIGYNLTSNVTITAPAGFEISTRGGTDFVSASPITLTPTNGVVNQTIFVRSNSTSTTTFTGNITHATTGVTTISNVVNGNNTACTGGTNTITFTTPGTFNWNTAASWSLGRVPLPCDDVVINYNEASGGADLREVVINIPVTIRSLSISINPAGNGQKNLDIYNSQPLVINGDLSINTRGGNSANTEGFLGANNSTIQINGNTTIGGTNGTQRISSLGSYVGTNSFIFKGNLTFNAGAFVYSGGTYKFEGAANQTITTNATTIPTGMSFQNMVISNTNNSIVSIAGATTNPINVNAGNLTIASGSTLTIPQNYRINQSQNLSGRLIANSLSTLNIGGNAGGITGSNFPSGFDNYTLDSTSTVHFNRAGTQTIPGITQGITSYGNLTLTGNTKTLGADIAIFRNLNIGATTTMALGNFNTTLRSNSQTTANITAIPTDATITYGTGRFNIERYLFAKKSWRSLATPIDPTDPTTVTQAWRENGSALTSTGFGTQISGPATYIGMDQTTIRGSMKSFSMTLGDFVDVNDATNPIYNPSGYFVFVRGDRAVNTAGTTGATTLRMSGRIVRNDQVYNITAGRFLSIGNPYASRVDVRSLTFGGGAVQSFYVWNPNSPGSFNVGGYQVYVKEIAGTNYRLNGLPLGAVNNFIESGQAVFFQANATAGTVTFTEASKASGSSLVSRMGNTERPGATTPSLAINLKTNDTDGTLYDADGIVVDFDANFANTIDENDVRKVSNTVDNLSMRSNGVLLTANRRGLLNSNDTIFLNIAGLRTTNYRFEIDPSLIDGLGLEAFLVDAFLGTQTPVSLTDVTTINFATTADAASKANTRFMLVFKPAAVLPVTFTTITAVRDAINKQVAVRWNVATEINITRYEVERSATGTGFATIATVNPTNNNGGAVSYSINDAAALATTNFYRIKAVSNDGSVQYSAVVKVAALATASGFVVYPNPVVGNTINLQANQVTKGAYSVQLVNQAGQIVYKGLLNINSDNQSTSVVLDAATAAGVYTLVLENEGKKVQIAVLVK